MINFSDNLIYNVHRADGPAVIKRVVIGVTKEWYSNKTVLHNSSGPAVIDEYVSRSYRAWFNYDKNVEDTFFKNLGIDPYDPTDEELLIIQMHMSAQ